MGYRGEIVRLAQITTDTATHYFANRETDFTGQHYLPWLIVDDAIEHSKSSPDTGSLTLQNVDGQLAALMDAEDWEGATVIIYEYFTGLGAGWTEAAELTRGRLNAYEAGPTTCRWDIIPLYDTATIKAPLRQVTQPCPFRFKSPECGYAGAESSCDKTYATCNVTMGNAHRFGGCIQINAALQQAYPAQPSQPYTPASNPFRPVPGSIGVPYWPGMENDMPYGGAVPGVPYGQNPVTYTAYTGTSAGQTLPAKTDEEKAQFLETALNQGMPLAWGRHLVGGNPCLQYYDAVAKITYLFIILGEGQWDALEYLYIDSVKQTLPDYTLAHFHPGLDGESGAESAPSTPNQKLCSFFPPTLTATTFSRTTYLALAIPDDPNATTTSDKVAVFGIYRTRRVRIFDAAGNQTAFEYSANPVWIALDAFISLKLKPHGAVNEALTTAEKAQINFAIIKDSADYCDTDIGGGVKRFECHAYFKDDTTLKTVLETICATCRGYARVVEGKFGFYVDQPRASVFTFTADHIIKGSLRFSGPDLRSAANRLNVKIRDLESGGLDPSRDFAPATLVIDDEAHQDKFGVVTKDIDLGANTKERSLRLGTYWQKLSLLPRWLSFAATSEAGGVEPGDRVEAPLDKRYAAAGDWTVISVTDNPGRARNFFLQPYDAALFSDLAPAIQEPEETNVNRKGKPYNGMDVIDPMVLASSVPVVVPDGTSVDLKTSTGTWKATADPGSGDCEVGSTGEPNGEIYLETSGDANCQLTLQLHDPCLDLENPDFEAMFAAHTYPVNSSGPLEQTTVIGLVNPNNQDRAYFSGSTNWLTVTIHNFIPSVKATAIPFDTTPREWMIVRDADGLNFYSKLPAESHWTLVNTHTTRIPEGLVTPFFNIGMTPGGVERLVVANCRYAAMKA
ncbi:MAG: hypothetical protein WC485_00970 [Opitutaceae bacterium]